MAVSDGAPRTRREAQAALGPYGRVQQAINELDDRIGIAKGGRVLVPADKIAYVEFGGPEARRVGFGNIV